jgi:Cys-tRNA(Pro)/Cys-tRNA(Cys) deacylase
MRVKTNVIRLLESHHIAHTVHVYETDEHFDAEAAAHKLGVDPERVFKTLVASGGGTVHLVFCLPAVLELDLRKAAAAAGVRQVSLIRQDDLLALTGYIRGGCSPLAMKKAFPTYVDESAELFDVIYISGGQRGVQVGLAPADLLALGKKLLPRCELADLS